MNELRNDRNYMGSTLWTFASIINGWLLRKFNKDPMRDFKPLQMQLKLWQREDETKKAEVFTFEELNRFWSEAPDDDEFLVIKAGSAIAVHSLARSSELLLFKRADLVFNPDVIIGYLNRIKRRTNNRNRVSA
jgi:integrase